MNRAERRRLARESSKEPVYQLRGSDISRMEREAREDSERSSVEAAIVLLLALPVKVLREEYHWGDGRLPSFAEKLADEYSRFAEGEMTLREYADYVYEHTGIRFERGGD